MKLRAHVVLGLLLSPLALADEAPVFSVAPAIQECSASVWDSGRQGVWTLGDSGPGLRARLGFTDTRDWTTRPLEITGALNHDWEALVQDSRGHLWILDVGDNDSKRAEVLLHEVDPDREQDGRLDVLRTIKVRYADGARDVEAAVLDGTTLLLFEKVMVGTGRVAAVELGAGTPDTQVARPRGRLPVTGPFPVTDAAVTPHGTVYLLTYLGILECRNCFDDARRSARRVRTGFRGQLESLLALDEGRFLVAAEDGRFFAW